MSSRRARRYARYEEVRALRAAARSIRAIAQLTGLNRRTVRRFLRAETFPEHAPCSSRPPLLTPFVPFLRERWNAGCHNVTQLWCELRAQGLTGSYSIVAAHLRAWRDPLATAGMRQRGSGSHARRSATTCSPRQTMWLLLHPTETLTADERTYVLHLQRDCPDVLLSAGARRGVRRRLTEHDVAELYAWLHRVEECGIAEFLHAGTGMWKGR